MYLNELQEQALSHYQKGKKYINQTNNIVKNKRKKKTRKYKGELKPLQCYKSHSASPAWASGLTDVLSFSSLCEREFANQQKWWLACSRLCFPKTNTSYCLLQVAYTIFSVFIKEAPFMLTYYPAALFSTLLPNFAHTLTLF